MQNYYELLSEIGILDHSLETNEESQKNISEIINGPMVPHGYTNNGVAIFTMDQLNIGKPEDFGFNLPYQVIEGQPEYAMNYQEECKKFELRQIHRYSRCDRFKTVLNDICGQRGNIPDMVLEKLKINHTQKQMYTTKERYILQKLCAREYNQKPKDIKYKQSLDIKNIPRDEIWDYLRSILKKHGLSKYYNRIPAILGRANYSKGKCTIPNNIYAKIITDFNKMHRIFPKIKKELAREYFPSLRYVAYRLMSKYDINTDWKITVVKTDTKIEALESIYNKMWEEIEKEEEEELIKFFSF